MILHVELNIANADCPLENLLAYLISKYLFIGSYSKLIRSKKNQLCSAFPKGSYLNVMKMVSKLKRGCDKNAKTQPKLPLNKLHLNYIIYLPYEVLIIEPKLDNSITNCCYSIKL